MAELFSALSVSASGMRAQSTRLRIISENIANSDTTGETPGSDPYRRKTITFKDVMDKDLNVDKVAVSKIATDTNQDFIMKFMPDHPAADENGYVKMPNINPLIEAMDMREAQRSYEANLGMMDQSRNMYMQTVDLLRR